MHARAVLLAVLCAAPSCLLAYDNGLGLKPFLGWQSWCAVGNAQQAGWVAHPKGYCSDSAGSRIFETTESSLAKCAAKW